MPTLLDPPSDAALAEASLLALDLAIAFLGDPDRIQALAQEFGLWEALAETLAEPLQLEHCRRDPNEFIEYAIRDNKGRKVAQSEFHREWQAMLSEEGNTLIKGPREHGKSIQISSRVVFELGNDATLRIKIVCAEEGAAQTILGLIKRAIKDNPRVRAVFPRLTIDEGRANTKDGFSVVNDSDADNRDPNVKAVGVFEAAAGGRADILICDDVVDYTNAVKNGSLRVKVIEALRDGWFALMSVGESRLWWLCTPYHAQDATAVFEDQKEPGPVFDRKWEKPAIGYRLRFDEHGVPVVDPISGKQARDEQALWPENYSLQKLARKKRTLGPLAFARQFMLQVVSDADLVFPRAAIDPSLEPMLWKIGQALPIDGPAGDIPDWWPTFGGVDLASSLDEKRGAWFVIWTIAYCHEDQRVYLKEMVRAKGQFFEIQGEIVAAYDRHKWEYAYVENNAFQRVVAQELSRTHKHIPIEQFHTNVNKSSESIGLKGMAATMAKGAFAIPGYGIESLEEHDDTPLGIFLNELLKYPGAKFSDTVMALWFAWQAFREGYDPVVEDWTDLVFAT